MYSASYWAAFSPSGRDLALVNEKGHLYQLSELDASPLMMKKLATSKELTARSAAYGMGYIRANEEDLGVGEGW